jgi:threonyl-tRNA synthetase
MERFVGGLIEHFGGKFPVWCAPTQVALVPIREEHAAYCKKLEGELQNELFRVDAMLDAGHMNNKIKEAQKAHIPFTLVAGDREAADGTVAVRRRDTRDQEVMPFAQFMALLKDLRARKARDLGEKVVKVAST